MGAVTNPWPAYVRRLDRGMHISTRLFLLSFPSSICFMASGCGSETFKLKVDHVFYIRTIDRVIVTGSVTSGSVKPGDRLTVRTGDTAVPVTVERLEHPQRKIERAARGDQVGMVLSGIHQDQVRPGDFVEAPCLSGLTPPSTPSLSGVDLICYE